MINNDDPDDELLSAAYDAMVSYAPSTDDDRRVRDDTFAQYRMLGDALRDVPEPHFRLDDLRAEVLAALPAAAPRAASRRHRGWLVGAAAALLLVGGFVALLQRSDTTDDASSSARAGSAEFSTREPAADAASATGATGATGAAIGTGATAPSPASGVSQARQLGTFATIEALVTAYRSPAAAGDTASTKATESGARTACARPVLAEARLGDAAVFVAADGDDLAIVDQQTCRVVSRFRP